LNSIESESADIYINGSFIIRGTRAGKMVFTTTTSPGNEGH